MTQPSHELKQQLNYSLVALLSVSQLLPCSNLFVSTKTHVNSHSRFTVNTRSTSDRSRRLHRLYSSMAANRPDKLSPPRRPSPKGILKNVSYNRDFSLARDGRASTSFDLNKEPEQDETSPLIQARAEGLESPLTLSNLSSPQYSDDWDEGEKEETKSSWYLFLLTLSIGG